MLTRTLIVLITLLTAAPRALAADCPVTPIATAQAWLKTYWTGDLVGAWKLLHPDEKAAATDESLWSEQTKAEMVESFVLRRKAELLDIISTEDDKSNSATARLSVRTPLAVAEYEALRKATSSTPREAHESAIARLKAAIISGTAQTAPMITEIKHLMLLRSGTGWCVNLGLADSARHRSEEKVQIDRLYLRAKTALPKISVTDLRRGKGYFNHDYRPGVFGVLINHAEDTLTEVVLTIEFLDKTGRAIYEKTWSVGRENYSPEGAIKPNHRKQFSFRADDVPAEWAGGLKAHVKSVKVCPEMRFLIDRYCATAQQR